MKSPLRAKWRISIYLRFVALIASLAAVIAFAYSQALHDSGIVLAPDLGQHMVTPATGTVSQSILLWRVNDPTVLLILLRPSMHSSGPSSSFPSSFPLRSPSIRASMSPLTSLPGPPSL